MTDLSVVLATRNRRDELLCTLERLAALEERPEIVVVDNASGDGTPASVREAFPFVDVIALPANAGAAARTMGLRRARNEVVAFCDDDSWWEPGALSRAAALFDRHDRLGLVAARVIVEPHGVTDPTCACMARSPLWSAVAGPSGPRRAVIGFLACGAVVRKRAYVDAGGFRPELVIGGEEALLAIDLAVRGWERVYAPDVVAHHMPSPRRDDARRRRLETRNALWTLWARRGLGPAARGTARVLAGAVGDRAALGGAADAVVGFRWARAHRRRVPDALERELCALEEAQ